MKQLIFGAGLLIQLAGGGLFAQEPVTAYMQTPWTKKVNRKQPLNEYPRPALVRKQWQNLNGVWQYAITAKESGIPDSWDGTILVPFPLESRLSGVQKRIRKTQVLWYQKTLSLNRPPAGKRTLLHIGAADWETTVFVNGQQVSRHRGGYTPISADITDALKNGSNRITVSVWDPTDEGEQARGKQVLKPGGIYYTSATGIWQTVWLETVASTFIKSYKTISDIEQSMVTIQPEVANLQPGDRFALSVLKKGRLLLRKEFDGTGPLAVKIPSPELWSPDNPHLYDFKLRILRGHQTVDQATGYFGMRTVAVKKDEKGVNRIFLNDKPLFMYGPLDQGFWPDGIYTAPTDEALASDVKRMKEMGFNMVRKHVKVEPSRWYYHCDKIGLIVWQDMPSGYGEIVPVKDHDHSIEGHWLDKKYRDVERNSGSEADFREEWQSIIKTLGNHPGILVWVPFNESWGQFKTNEILNWTKELDPTRIVDGPSGWIDRGGGELRDYHLYGDRIDKTFPTEDARALVIGEFGGLGYVDAAHAMKKDAWSYSNFKTPAALSDAYRKLIDKIRDLKEKGFSAAVYTQLTDVETEVNGIITYDRFVLKMNAGELKSLHQVLYK